MPVAQRKRHSSELNGYLLECDVPTMQFIRNLEDTMKKKPGDRIFIIEQFDDTHALIRRSHKGFVDRKVDEFLDSNVWSSVERTGEDLDLA